MARTGMADQLRANERIWTGFRELELAMLAAGSLADVLAVVTRVLPERFPAVNMATLAWHDPEYELTRLLERELGEFPHGFIAINDAELAEQVPHAAPQLGRASDACRRLLFPDRPPSLIQSVAVVPLRLRGAVVGSLNQASRDPAHFNRESATDLLEHMAAVAAICIDNAVNRARLERDVITDPLTGVSNRRFFARRLQEEVSQWQRQGGSLSCLFVDLDHFKQINDRHGHQVGDEALRRVAQLLGESLRASDVLARYGGEEFALLLPDTDAAQAGETAERLRARIAGRPLALAAGRNLTITASIGCATLDQPNTADVATLGAWLVRSADAALYAAKSEGRNRAVAVAVEMG
jgi:diguanylate cyclase (GGDEF)-like protein